MSSKLFLNAMNMMKMSLMSVDELYEVMKTNPDFNKMGLDEQGEAVLEMKAKLEKL